MMAVCIKPVKNTHLLNIIFVRRVVPSRVLREESIIYYYVFTCGGTERLHEIKYINESKYSK